MPKSSVFARWVDWLTRSQRNLRSFSVLRIIYGVGLLLFLVPSAADRAVLWGHASFWIDPEASRRGFITFDVLFSKDNAMLFDLAFFGLCALVVLFTLGYRTRVVTPLMLVLLVSLHSNNPYVLNGGDNLYRITLVFMLFANLSQHYSLDALRRKRQAARHGSARRIVPEAVSSAAHNVALVLCCFQIIVVYSVSGVWKLVGEDWLSGTALFYALRLDVYMSYPLVNELLWQSSLVISVSTFVAMWTQTLFVFLVLWRPTRIFALVALIFMHLGIAVLLGLWSFSLAMIALDMLFIRDSTWERVGSWLRSTAAWRAIDRSMLIPLRRRLPVRGRTPATKDGRRKHPAAPQPAA